MSLSKGTEIIKAALAQMPSYPGIYRMLGEKDEPLYIGKAKNLPKRVLSYTQTDKLPYRLQRMVSLTLRMEYTITKNEAEALLLEANLVQSLQPRFNILLKDDKSFPYILITADKEYNMMLKYRGKRTGKGHYFGPFPSAGMVYHTLNVLQKAFPLRTCTDATLESRERPCLEYQIKRCTAPCVNKISRENYQQIVDDARDFLNGRRADIQQKLSRQMDEFAANMEYEKAAAVRDRIYALTKIQNENKLTLNGVVDADVLALVRQGGASCVQIFFIRGSQNYGGRSYFPRHAEDASDEEIIESFIGLFYQTNSPPKLIITNTEVSETEVLREALFIKYGIRPKIEKKSPAVLQTALLNAQEALRRKLAESSSQTKLLKMMCERFELPEMPQRIEIYDNSHIQGTSAIGAMVVASPEGFDKKHYRKFNMKVAKGGDDYAMMREMLSRRFIRAREEGLLPDIAIIDGGKGQLSAAAQALEDLGIHKVCLIAIAKGPDRNAGNEEYHMAGKEPFRLEHGSELAYFMQRLRDEAHRYAISTHRAKREKDIKKSQLDEIPGIGGVRKKALLGHFGGVSEIKLANIEELMKVKGVNRQTAEIIYNYFH